jgi:hypothetical protein
VPDAAAIHTFLARAYANWKPRPRYVLLVGDASYDPHDYLGAGFSDFVPSASIQTADSIVPSDNALADFNGDGVPDIAVGRLPVDAAAETATVVQKIVSYETQPPASGRSAMFVADHDPRLDLEGAADSLATLLPGSMPVQRVYRRDSPDVGSFRTTLRTALDTGPEIVDYVGHGGPEVWSESYIDYKQAGQLQNAGRLSLYVMTSCLNAWFLEPKSESLAEALLNAPNGGAIATVSSSGTETLEDGSKINREFLRALFAGDSPTIGAAFQAATRAAGGSQLTRISLLFGDPASRLR